MPEVNASQIIGKTLFAKRQLDKLNGSLQKIGIFDAGQSVGVVYSYIQRNGIVYWMFYDAFGKPYYVKHNAANFQFSTGVKEALTKEAAEKEKQLISQKGAIPYYIEKYGKWVLGGIIAVSLFRVYLKNK